MTQPRFLKNAALAAALLALQSVAVSQTAQPADVSALALGAPVTATAPSVLRQQIGQVQVVVRLADAPLAIAAGANAKRVGSTMSLAQRQAYMAAIKSKQDALMAQIGALGGSEIARVGKVYNALVIAADASKLPQIAALPGVSALRPVIDHQISLSTTVPYIGAAALQSLGTTGAGVKIAVLDSGIDYTHRNLGGSGNVADFNAAAAAANGAPPAGLYPTAKVIGGWDFVGGSWPNGPLTPDANPIDAGSGSGHGTHVADIAGGASLDGQHKGVAPGAQLYAVKVCSSVSTSCSGVAMLQGLDWAMDPRGDLSFTGAADVVNMSLGANYGQRENPSTEAVSNLVRFGIVVAVAAGNAGDRPYIVSSPSNAPEAISVAQTSMPGDKAFPLVIDSPAAIAGTYRNTAKVDWAPVVGTTSGSVAYIGRGCPANSISAGSPADPLLASPAGKIALIDRGACSVSLKVDYAVQNGAIGVLIGLVASGDAVSFSNGGGSQFKPTLVIQQSLANAIKANIAAPVMATISDVNVVALAGSMASTSARGPAYNFSAIKPEIGAPGASVSAINGSGNGEGGFGGTSGATPMIAGSAALLIEKFPNAVPSEIKSRLMNSASLAVYTNPVTAPGELAPISRIGGGEVRVDKAAATTTGVWDATNAYNVGLSFGSMRLSAAATYVKKVAVRNYSNTQRTYTITPSFRYANDQANGAVSLTAPATITVGPNATSAFTLQLRVDPSKLPAWNLASASSQGTGSLLQAVEYDGYVTVADTTDGATVPWHILPHKAHNLVASTTVPAGGALAVANANTGSALASSTDVFALTGTSPQMSTVLPPYGGGQVLIDMKAAGVRAATSGGSLAVQFAIAGYGERAHPAYPAEFDIYVDANNDGVWDYVIYDAENGGFGATGQTIVYVQKLKPDGSADGGAVAKFYANEDLNSSNMIYTVLAADIGITAATQQFTYMVAAFDNYFTGNLSDLIAPMTHTLGTPRYSVPAASFTLGAGGAGVLPVSAVAGGAAASPSQTGFLLMHGNAKTGRESDVVTVTP